VLTRIEASTKAKWGTDAGVWIEEFITSMPPTPAAGAAGGVSPATLGAAETAFDTKFFSSQTQTAPGGAQPTALALNQGTSITMLCRAIKGPSDSANSDLMYAFLDELKASPLVDPKGTVAGDKIDSVESPYTFTFAVKVALKNPLKF
jgi:hypothetical protein